MARLVLAALVAAAACACVCAQREDAAQVEGYTYLYSTNVLVKQQSDVIRSFNTSAWAALGTDARGMHRCAKLCKKEGGGAVCKSWAFCWGAQKTCALLSRLPDSQAPAKPPTGVVDRLLNAQPYNPQCASGFSKTAAITHNLEASGCKAVIHANTVLSDHINLPGQLPTKYASRLMRADYDPAQPSPVECCRVCEAKRAEGCSAWTYMPNGSWMDRAQKCLLRSGTAAAMSNSNGATSGVMLG